MYSRVIEKKGTISYFKAGNRITDTVTIERLNKLAIPPAWQEVAIAESPRSKIQATGRDQAGRKQAIYSEAFRARQEEKKFSRVLNFALQLPKLRRQIEKDIARRQLDKQKVLATIVTLIDQAYFRVGNEKYAKENQTYGVTTLRSKHLDITTTSVTFDFTGKSGKKHHKVIKDRTLARIIKQLDELPGHDIFRYIDDAGEMVPVSSNDVNQYIREIMGEEFSAKDFRTWGGTMIAASNLAIERRAAAMKERKKVVTATVKKVAKRLGNTPAVARSSYIDPAVIQKFMDTDDIAKLQDVIQKMKPKKYLKPEEQAVITLLKGTY